MVTEQKTAAQRAQDIRDLKNQISELSAADEGNEVPEILIRDVSPRLRKTTIYSMVNGEPLQVPRGADDRLLMQTLDKRDRVTGKYLFTARKEEAPTYKLGTVKCFLHPEAPERPILDEIGLGFSTCTKKTLASLYSKRIHAQHRHKQEWAMLQEHLEEEKENKKIAREEQQLAATLKLAEGSARSSKPNV